MNDMSWNLLPTEHDQRRNNVLQNYKKEHFNPYVYAKKTYPFGNLAVNDLNEWI